MALTKVTSAVIKDATITDADIGSTLTSAISGSTTALSSSVATRFDSRETDMTLATASIALNESNMTLATASIAAITASVSTINDNMTLATASIAAITASLGQPVNTDSNVQFADITSTGTITAVEVHTTFVSSSITVTSGSNIFGDDTSDSHRVTGSMDISGSLNIPHGDVTITDNLDVDGTTNLDVVDIDGNVDVELTASIGKVLVDGDKSSAASPGLAFDNDTDTGIVWGGNNALSIATGGTRRIEFKADYEVSIDGGGNNASTAASAYADNLVIRGANDGDGSGITIFSETDEFGTLYFGDGGTGNQAYRGYVQYSHAADTLQLGAAGAGKLILGTNSKISLSNNDSGDYNTIFGDSAGEAIQSGGNYNTVFGYQAGAAVTTGDQNTLFGAHTGDALIGGSYNTGMGVNTLGAMTTGQENVAIGNSAMALNVTGLYNTAVGQEAMYAAAGSHADNGEDANTAIGYKAMNLVNAGSNQNALVRGNVAIGYLALQGGNFGSSDLNLDYNIAIGINALNSTGATEHSNTVAIGRDACTAVNSNDASNTVAVGAFALGQLTSGQANTAIGYAAMYNGMDIGDFNTAVGYEALYGLNPGSDGHGSNTAVGYKAGYTQTTAENNTYVGARAGEAVTGAGNVIIGREAGVAMTSGGNCVIIGHAAAAANNTRDGLVIIGASAGTSLTSGDNNVFIGYNVGSGVTTGDHNTLVGDEAGRDLAGGSSHTTLIGLNAGLKVNTNGDTNNTMVGSEAGNDITSGTNNTGIGVGTRFADTSNNQTCLGVGATTDSANDIAIGNTSVDEIKGQVSFSTFSDERIKKNIIDGDLGLDFINLLKPRKFNKVNPAEYPDSIKKEMDGKYGEWTEAQDTKVWDGLIAQEVKSAMDTCGTTFSGWNEETNSKQVVAYEALVVPLVKAVQELSQKIENIEKTCKCMKEE